MRKKWVSTLIQATVITLTLVAVCQELEKPKEKRKWHGKVASFVPYDFRMPTAEKLKESYWNPYDKRILTPEVFGVGWAINFCTLLEKFRFINQDNSSEEDFLMPDKAMRDLLFNTTDIKTTDVE